MIKTQKTFRLTAVAAALAAVFGAAWADDEVEALTKPESSISIGLGNWSSDRPRLGMYDGMRDSGPYGLFDAHIVKRDDATGTWYKLNADRLGLDNRGIGAEYLRQGNIGFTLEYDRITRDDPYTFHTNLQGIGTTRLIQGHTTDYPSTSASLAGGTGRFAPQTQVLGLGTVREQIGASFYKNLMPGLDLNVTFKNEDKEGTRNWSRGGSQNAFFAVEPIDSTTRQLKASLSYSTPKLQLRGGYYGSWYQNNTSKMMVIGAANLDANTTYLSLPLDNEAHQLFLNGGYNFTRDTRGTFKVEYARARQNDHIPTTDIVSLSNRNPPSSLNAKVNTTLVQLGLNSRVTTDFTLNGNLRYHDKDDQTPIFDFIATHPYVRSSLRTLSGKVEGIYRLNNDYSVLGSLEERRQDRDTPIFANGTPKEGVVPFRQKNDETTGRIELRRAMTETVNGSLSWVHARRDGSAYELMQPNPVTVNGIVYDMADKINPLNVADRTRDKIRAVVDWVPHHEVSLQFVAENGRDKYGGRNPFGLEKGTARLYSVDASWAPGSNLGFDVWYSYDKSKAEQTGFLPTSEMRRYNLEDGANSLGLGVKWKATSKLQTGANLEWSRNVGKYNSTAWSQAGAPATGGVNPPDTSDPADITNKITRLSLFALYTVDKQSSFRFDFIHERWNSNDWSWLYNDTVTPFRMNDGTFVTANSKQISNFFGIRYIYKFR
jgi:MtrB/PioB family decaheme-associated outer membrane protein